MDAYLAILPGFYLSRVTGTRVTQNLLREDTSDVHVNDRSLLISYMLFGNGY